MNQSRPHTRQRARYERAIGKAIVAFNQLEVAFIGMLEALIDPERPWIGEAIGWSVGFGQKLDIAVALAKLVCNDTALRARIQDLATKSSDYEAQRNRLAHAELWLDMFDGVHRLRKGSVRERKGFRPQDLALSPGEIDSIASEIDELATDVDAVATFLRASIRTDTASIPGAAR
jgi:outer membrane murein-binding lipoprotein Lpp